LFLLGLPVVAVVAVCSWHFVEKPILGLRKRFSFVARVRGVASETDVSVAPLLPVEVEPVTNIMNIDAIPEASPSR
jgi:hypothetical protein